MTPTRGAGPVSLRPVEAGDAAALCALLNPIIEAGGTTAHRRPFTEEEMRRHYVEPPLGIACTLALDEAEGPLGFQALEWADPAWRGPDPLPEGWAVVATFVRIGSQGRGVGRALFAETLRAAEAAGVMAIDAAIRRHNAGGLRFYDGLGFRTWREDAEAISKRRDV